MRIPHPIPSLPLAQFHLFIFSLFPSPNSLPFLSAHPKSNFRLPFTLHSSRLSAMSAESDAFLTAAEENAKYGFQREEMYKTNLHGTVDPPYDRHVFLSYKSHHSWPSRLEDSDADPLPKLFAAALKARKKDAKLKTRMTVCEQNNDENLVEGDVLVFPEMVKYRGLLESEVTGFVEDVLVHGNPWQSGESEPLTGSYVFVCAHNNRDRRCGVCGPVLIEKFKDEIESRDLKNQVFVAACSHVGGHKYAGNVIIFSAGPDGKIAGNWYGYVTPDDVPDLLDKQIAQGEIIDRIWRGQMGAIAKQAENGEEPRLTNGTDLNVNEKQQQEEIAVEDITKGGCCQGTKGVSCCREDENVGKKSYCKEQGGLSCWLGKFEQRHLLTTAGVVGAAAAVAVAYGFYRRAR